MFALLSKWPLVRQIRERKDGTRSERRLPRKWYWKTPRTRNSWQQWAGPAILLAMDSKAKQPGRCEGGKVWFISGVLRGFGRELASRFLKQQKPMFVLAFLIISTLITTSTLMAQKAVASPLAQETITELMSKDLAGFPDKEVLMYTVDFPPGFSSPVHRHEAQVSVYVLEGSVVMQVRGGEEVTLQPGQTFYEDPKDVHVVSRNASSTKPAKFLVFLIHKKGTPLVMPAT
ncbi:MAG: Cupin domain protein [Candidatus Udaeobacter sp.]|nr:MAG: Cupin domain protein [Candidatus Udaeobacter sp.]